MQEKTFTAEIMRLMSWLSKAGFKDDKIKGIPCIWTMTREIVNGSISVCYTRNSLDSILIIVNRINCNKFTCVVPIDQALKSCEVFLAPKSNSDK